MSAPRYETRHRQRGYADAAEPWSVVRLHDGFDDGVPVTWARPVSDHWTWDGAQAEAQRRNELVVALRRIGVAVAVWAGMAMGAKCERARLRRWQLRLRWRAANRDRLYHFERLAFRDHFLGVMCDAEDWSRCVPRYMQEAQKLPIAGPRGVLP